MTQFRPCIDLHNGQVKQIVGGTLNDEGAETNFISEESAEHYAALYKKNDLTGGHVIALGPGNKEAALLALGTWQGGLQFGGGINPENASEFLDAGASHVIVTSYLFDDGKFSWEKLESMENAVGKNRLVLDLSCRRVGHSWMIATNRWQTVTEVPVNKDTLDKLSDHCSEFLIHAADVEGLQAGIDAELVTMIGQNAPIPVTYAGGAKSLDDLKKVEALSGGKVDLTIGSALDIFGGKGVTLRQCINWNHQSKNN